jgi:hypothetical protein
MKCIDGEDKCLVTKEWVPEVELIRCPVCHKTEPDLEENDDKFIQVSKIIMLVMTIMFLILMKIYPEWFGL